MTYLWISGVGSVSHIRILVLCEELANEASVGYTQLFCFLSVAGQAVNITS